MKGLSLIENRKLRKQLGDFAKEFVYERFNYKRALSLAENILMED